MRKRSNHHSPTPDNPLDQVDDDWRWAQNLPALRDADSMEIAITVASSRGLTAEDFDEFVNTGNTTTLQRAVVREHMAQLRGRERRPPGLIERILGLDRPSAEVLETLHALTDVSKAASTAIANDYELQQQRIRRHGVQQEFHVTQLQHKTRLVDEEVRLAEAEERLEKLRARREDTDPAIAQELLALGDTVAALQEELRRRADPRECDKTRREDEIAAAAHEARLSEFALAKARNAAAAKTLRQPPADEFAEALAAQNVVSRRLKRLDDDFNPKLADTERKHGADSEAYQSLLTQYNQLRVRILEGRK